MLCEAKRVFYPKPPRNPESSDFRIVSFYCKESIIGPDGKTNLMDQVFTAKGLLVPYKAGIDYDLKGHWEKQKGRWTFCMESFDEVIERTQAGIETFLVKCVKGIGPRLARKIYETFGDETLEIFDKSPERLMEVPKISESVLEKAMLSYMEHRGARNVIMTLVPLGVPQQKAMSIYKRYRDKAMGIIQETPYRLCFMEGIGFKLANDIAMKTGNNDPLREDRIEAGIWEVLMQAEYGGFYFNDVSGHCCVEYNELIRKVCHLLKINPEPVVEGIKRMSDKDRDAWEKVQICLDPESNPKKYYVYRYKKSLEEMKIADSLVKKMKYPFTPSYDIENEIMAMEKRMKTKLADGQKQAVVCSLSNMVSVITGGPGTGKTTVINFIRRIYHKCHPDAKILLCAPTGTAATRMSEATGAEACTANKAWNIIPTDDNSSEGENVDYDLIICDEMSMVDSYLFSQMMSHTYESTQIVLIGDIDQLESVGAGAVLRDLLESGVIPFVKLTEVFRQKGESLVAQNAKLIREGNSDFDFGSSFQYINAQTFEHAAYLMNNLYLTEVATRGISNVMMLSPFRKNTESSVVQLNRIRDKINPHSQEKYEVEAPNDILFREGDRVMNVKRNVDDISNGDVGIISKIRRNEDEDIVIDVVFSSNRKRTYERKDFGLLEHAYAMTVHKSQGNEADVVIMNVMDGHGRMLKRNLLYTGITRAKKKVYLVGQESAIRTAVERGASWNDRRNTLLAQRIRYLFNRE